ncbi:hypothetical protein HL653_02185 [Sphingomonas sp. AP4-R1]|uniref:hypothetical protein n=1 Tax=Sphingomonas sp. AP4-R1 TaxID=2735134 RepID=UPI0014937C1F|nr:hypothetical protein [Sphingomonas sp. AP4-R1]QJU56752.1 hypothetical protein HL653_02185 [Sphingomonas sp. AP4-R1]
MRMVAVTIALVSAAPAFAQTAGPPAPVAAKTTPAEQAIEAYQKSEQPRAAPVRCRSRGGGDTVTVCGVREGARAPLPNDQSIRDGSRTAIGELPSTAGIRYTNPVGIMPRTGAQVTLRGDGKITGKGMGQ